VLCAFCALSQVPREQLNKYCPTLDMIADYFTKPLQGSLFRKLRDLFMCVIPADYEKYKRRYMEVSIWRKQKKAEKERTSGGRDKS
jgi:hypothetical protein